MKTRDKEGHSLIRKGSIQEEIQHLLNTGPHKCIKQVLTDIKGKFDTNTIMVEDFNTPLTSMNRSSR